MVELTLMTEKLDLPWLQEEGLQSLLALLNEGEGEARVAGGAVRNALLDEAVADIDIATTLVPRDVILRANAAGLKTVPTGIEHGTVTIVMDDQSFEVTTLRSDVETDGRHAQVRYGTDWREDAMRRDLTINALYLDADGTIFDPLDGIEDVLARTVRFIGAPEDRIREDYLRILRFFRFFAWYGNFRPDADGLRACARLKEGLSNLSVERVWHELVKTLTAPDPGRAILWMRQTGVLSNVLPESEKWGIDYLMPFIRTEKEHGWQADGVRRLMTILPPQEDKITAFSDRLKLPNKVRDRLVRWAQTDEPQTDWKKPEFYRYLYAQDIHAVEDRLRLAIARDDATSGKFLRQLKWLSRWERPIFPLKGQHLLDTGLEAGPQISDLLGKIESRWIESDFTLSAEQLLAGDDIG